MAGKRKKMTDKEQSERFQKEVQRMIDAGELNPIEAEAALDRLTNSLQGSDGEATLPC